MLCDHLERPVLVDGETVVSLAGQHVGGGQAGDVRVQRIGGLEHECCPPRAAEREEEALQDLVRAVRAEHLTRAHAVMVC